MVKNCLLFGIYSIYLSPTLFVVDLGPETADDQLRANQTLFELALIGPAFLGSSKMAQERNAA